MRPASVECARICGADIILAGLESEEELSRCERELAHGRRFWSKGSFAIRAPNARCFATYYGKLSSMERTVCTGLLEGKKYAAIALELGVTLSSISTYIQRIFSKFSARTSIELARLIAGAGSNI